MNVTGATDFFYPILMCSSPRPAHPELVEGLAGTKSGFDLESKSYLDFLKHATPLELQFSRGETMWGCSAHVHDLQLRVPFTYNFVRSAQMFVAYDPLQRAFFGQNMVIKTDRGKCASALTTWLFDEEL